MTYDFNVFQIIGFLTLSGIILRSTLSIVGQNWVRTYHFLGTFILLPNIYLINDLLGEPANYWYLQAKPDGASLMDMFPDPPHSLFYTVPLSVAVFYLIYLPYFFKDRVSK